MSVTSTAELPERLIVSINNGHSSVVATIDAAGRPASVTELGAGDIGGMTLKAGVYKWGTGLLIPTDITLSGSAADVSRDPRVIESYVG